MSVLAAAIVMGGMAAAGGAVAVSRKVRRTQASQVPQGESVLRQARAVSVRIFVDRDLLAGPKAGAANRAQADLVLTGQRLLLATHHGRLLELTAGRPGSVRCTGPRRLVIEAEHAQVKGTNHIRAEMILDQAEAWAADAAQHLGSSRSALPEG